MDRFFVGQLALMPYGFVPYGWMECAGQPLNKRQYTQLFGVIGTTYGGSDTTYNLPDLRGRAMVCRGSQRGGSTYELGNTGGVESVTLLTSMMPSHSHTLVATSAKGTTNLPTNALLATAVGGPPTGFYKGMIYNSASPNTKLASTLLPTGGQQPHNNMQPCVALRYCIAYV